MLKEITYKDAKGNLQPAAYMTTGAAYKLTGGREQFAQLMAGGSDAMSAYCTVFNVVKSAEQSQEEYLALKEKVKALCHDTSVVLRIQELKQPVLRKLHRKIEYTLEQALAQCQIAWDLSYAQSDTKGLLAAIKMQADLSKLLVQQIDVTHKHGLLDNEDTADLLLLLEQVKVRRKRMAQLTQIEVEKSGTGSTTPHQAPFVEAEMVPSGGSTNRSG